MFDEIPPEQRKIAKTKSTSAYNWDLIPKDDLLRYYDEIGRRLPPVELSKLDIEKELMIQYYTVRALQSSVMDDDEIPLNQRAQVANTVASSVKALADLQEKVYTSERFKAIENLLIRTLVKLPEDVAAAFIVEYEKILVKHA
jgi:hypothetical protein